MSVQVKRRRESAAFLSTYAGAAGELLVDTTNNRLLVQDGATPGGWPVLGSPLATIVKGANGSLIQMGLLEEELTLSGASVTSTIQIPERAIVLAVSVFVVATIAGATSYSVDAATAPGGGAGATGGQFGSGLSLPEGSNNVGVIGPTAWYAPSTIELTAAGGNFAGGAVRISIQYLQFGAPTS